MVTSEAQGQEKGLSTLECDIQQRKEKQGPNDLWRKGHLKDGGAQLDVLTSCLHGNGSTASKKKKRKKKTDEAFLLHGVTLKCSCFMTFCTEITAVKCEFTCMFTVYY